MLPRVATTTGTTQPTPALPAEGPVDAAAKPQLSAAALANLRAEVLLRLIETMLKHMPRTGQPSPNRDLLETLLTILKTLPGKEGESGRKLADLIAKLPAEIRPAVEKLISTVLSAMPTRTLVEIVRNPNGPEAQKLASLLATNLTADDTPAAGQTSQQKPLALTAQQLAVVGRHGMQQVAQLAQLPGGDARTLQAALKRIFGFDGATSKPLVAAAELTEAVETTTRIVKAEPIAKAETAGRTEKAVLTAKPENAEKAEPTPTTVKTEPASRAETRGTVVQRAELAGSIRQQVEMPALLRTPETRSTVTSPASVPVLPVTDAHSRIDANEVATPHQVDAKEHETATPATVRREETPAKTPLANVVGQALARSVLQAVARDLPPALMTQAVAHLVENLSPEEATFLRTLLERPLDLVIPPEGEFAETDLPPVEGDPAPETIATPEQDAELASTDLPEEAMRARPDPTQTASVPARQTPVLTEEARPAQRLADAGAPQVQIAAQPDLAPPTVAALREGVPLAFVPYTPVEEDLDWSETREAETDEATDEDAGEGNGGDTDDENTGDGEGPETPDMARRREKTAEMVGVIEPGLVFYQKLGDYWT
ncbi:hypothetical protein MUO32_18340 [Shinella sp. CPCC 101442]|uniref:hypothetical protein n=1 Tax=Shinella sp. CPCC 101442 TaxID=2932265 RepID=UPI002152283F|nr:hypothetical protein [Shinella sp. CPCC 101442]MCR6500997.1 hypothetical protein [Shinella sp. CPCC 101442]